MQSSEQRECLNSVLKGALHVGLLAFDFIYSRCMQSASHGRIPSHISGKEKQVCRSKKSFCMSAKFLSGHDGRCSFHDAGTDANV